jgi:cell division protein FtsB
MMRAMHARPARKRPGPRIRVGRAFVAATLALAGLLLSATFVGITVQYNALARDIAGYRADVATALADQAGLKQRITDQQTSDYVIDRARDLGYVRPNESLFGVEKSGQGSGQSSVGAKAVTSRIERWIAFFFGPRR